MLSTSLQREGKAVPQKTLSSESEHCEMTQSEVSTFTTWGKNERWQNSFCELLLHGVPPERVIAKSSASGKGKGFREVHYCNLQ